MASDDLGTLSDNEARQMLRFLLYRMPQETRGKLMAELPVAYAKVYPSAKSAVVDRVKAALERI